MQTVSSGIKIGVIPAAGSGSRLGYLSNLLPKTLFPVYDRPILHHVINLMESLGIEDIYIIINIHKEKIKEYLKNSHDGLKARIHFVEQKELNGTANAIMLIKNYTKNQPFLTMLGDECIFNDTLQDFIKLFYKNDCVAAEIVIREKDREIIMQTCCARMAKDNRIIEIIEKPTEPSTNIRGCGVYLFGPGIFEFIEKTEINPLRNEKDITTAIDNVAKAKKAFGYFLKGSTININNADELLKASSLAKKYINSFHVGKNNSF